MRIACMPLATDGGVLACSRNDGEDWQFPDLEARSCTQTDDPTLPVSSHADNACAYDENLARQSSVPKSPRTASYGQRARKSSADAFKCTVDLEEQGIADVWPTQNAGDFVAIAAQACQVASGSGLSQPDDHPWTELLASTKVSDLLQETLLGPDNADVRNWQPQNAMHRLQIGNNCPAVTANGYSV